ncbi:MAG: palindromic element RPE1 domain-containing protein, partial [Holosporales bacterium]|nr:palindromic element RPE1 domain-containing protein [Holosporales bacterium]
MNISSILSISTERKHTVNCVYEQIDKCFPTFIRVLLKPSESELLEGDKEHRTAAYLSVREDSSTESTHQEA